MTVARGWSSHADLHLVPDSDLRFVVVQDPVELADHVPAWQDLGAHAIEPNPFYEPFMLLPALDAFGKAAALQFVFIYAARSARPALIGFLPMERASQYKGLPLAHLRLWMHRHCYLCTPLIRRGQAQRCLNGYLDWLTAHDSGLVVEWRKVNGDGPFLTAFTEVLADAHRAYVPYEFRRALLKPRRDSDSLLKETHSRKARHELRRLERRLAERGEIEYRELQNRDDAAQWIGAFLDLESRGWKGRHGSALACRASDRNFFVHWASEAARRDRLMMLALAVGGRTVAMKCNVLAGTGAYAFKITYDEDYARYSPGVLLEMENIRRFHARGDLQWMDSCADPANWMMNHIWPDRRRIATLVMPGSNFAGALFVRALPFVRRLKRMALRPPTQPVEG
jgi:CelD/BcsL family acetyltransferase involved in cellulose biosynthesis